LNAYLILTTWRMSKMSVKCDMCGSMTNKYFTTYAGKMVFVA